ncbi:MAG: RNA polymerase sigma factor [Acidimicrobiales bacterium]
MALPEDAADVTAEVFVVASRRLADIPSGGAERAWLLMTARKVLANRHRGDRRRSALGDRLLEELSFRDRWGPEATVEAREGTREVVAALKSLPAVDRELVQLTAWEGLTPAQAAAVMEIPPGRARVRLHRARRRLAEVLQVTSEVDGANCADASAAFVTRKEMPQWIS